VAGPSPERHPLPIPHDREREIEEARAIQQAMLRLEPVRVAPFEVICKARPADEVGGDFLDYFWMLDGKLALFLGDVTGKGLPAALYAALAVGILRGLKKGGESPGAVLELLNRRLLDRQVPGRYCAVQYAVFDPSSQELTVVNAGLLPHPLHVSASGCRLIEGGGFPCGLFKSATYEQSTLRLDKGDRVFFSTDGLIEAENTAGEEFGLDRLMELCCRHSQDSAHTFLDGAFEAVDRFSAGTRQHDDMTAVVLQFG